MTSRANKKAAFGPPFFVRYQIWISDAPVDSLATAVETAIRFGPTPIQAPVNPVALAIETLGGTIVAGCFGTT